MLVYIMYDDDDDYDDDEAVPVRGFRQSGEQT